MDKKDSAYWCDKSDPLGQIHGLKKLEKAQQRITAYMFMAWTKVRRQEPEDINWLASRLDPDDSWLKQEIADGAMANLSFIDEADEILRQRDPYDLGEKDFTPRQTLAEHNACRQRAGMNMLEPLVDDPMKVVRDLCK
jgi:hypothetical protein